MLANYLLRAGFTAASAWARPAVGILEEAHLPFSAGPSDIDWNGHVNNGRILTLMDHGRLDFLLRSGLFTPMLKVRCQPVVANAAIRFRREVFPFRRCTLVTGIRGWDERRTYFSQRIERAGEVCAEADIDVAVRLGGKSVSIVHLLERAGHEVPIELHRARVDGEMPTAATR